MGVDLGNLSALRTFRVFRALKTVAIIPGLKTIVGAVIESVKNLKDVIILTCFSLSIFALLGLQIYMGVLTSKCIYLPPWTLEDVPLVKDTPEFKEHANNSTNQYYLEGKDEPKLCRPNAGLCPDNYTCLQGFGKNPNYGYTNFDSFGSALLSSFRLMTQDFWEDLYQCVAMLSRECRLDGVVVNLILAIVAMSYDELQKKAFEEEEAAAAEEAAMQAEAARLIEEEEEREREKRGEGVVKSPSDLSCSSYELFVGQEKGGEEKDSKERGSIRSAEGDSVYEREQKARLNNKMRKNQGYCLLNRADDLTYTNKELLITVSEESCVEESLSFSRDGRKSFRKVGGRGKELILPHGVSPQNWGGTELIRTVTCKVLKATANNRDTSTPCCDEFREPGSDAVEIRWHKKQQQKWQTECK
ncbi:sodium channel protein para [Trichonephila clavipes]|nr:sodium channel protein para [Trichonephila clavipes]